MLAGIAISGEDVGFGIGITIVDPLLVHPLVLQDFWVFQGMRIKCPCFQYDGLNWQERLHKADFSQMGFNFASHRGGKSPHFDRILSVYPASRPISGFPLTTIA